MEVLLDEVVKRKASDLHLQVGLSAMIRVDGNLIPSQNSTPLSEQMVETMVFSLLDVDQKQILLRDKEFDFSFAFGDLGRFRVNAFHERGNLAAAMRLIPNEIRSIEQLGLPKVLNNFANYPRGLVLVTGPTGSGKSSTIAALIDKINNERPTHIITVEDPIEYTHQSKKSVVAQREVHYDTYSFGAALRSALREDPDVVLIGEMRDLETIAAAITIAETGHLVFATLHTNSASQSIDRMIDVFPPYQQPQVRSQLGNILMAVISQRLIPALGGGRVPASEVMIATPAVRNIIREGKNFQLEAVIQTGTEYGMQSMDRTLVGLIHAGTISYDEARNYAVDVEEIDRMMRS
ncbi:type IV pilus twitching motility protein PilT [Candidatus Saccharibacteria bacterium]|nr:type IV pilus twitching motility protein PilT [Candidatus Saccharibacteria bacterium]